MSWFDSLADASASAPTALIDVMSLALCQGLKGVPPLTELPEGLSTPGRQKYQPKRGAKQSALPTLKPKYLLKLRVVCLICVSPHCRRQLHRITVWRTSPASHKWGL